MCHRVALGELPVAIPLRVLLSKPATQFFCMNRPLGLKERVRSFCSVLSFLYTENHATIAWFSVYKEKMREGMYLSEIGDSRGISKEWSGSEGRNSEPAGAEKASVSPGAAAGERKGIGGSRERKKDTERYLFTQLATPVGFVRSGAEAKDGIASRQEPKKRASALERLQGNGKE